MNDILFGNNNQTMMKKMAHKSFAANKKRNMVTVIAIILTTVLVTSVFGIGISYMKSVSKQAVMQRGTKAQILLVNPTEHNLLWLNRNPSVEKIGLERQIATAKNDQAHKANGIFLRWADNDQWKEMTMPAMGDAHGEYPQEKDEIFMPGWLLADMGIEHPEIGMEIRMTCRYGGTTIDHPALSDFQEQTFRLSGWYQDYSGNYQMGNAICYISEEYWKGSAATEDNTRCAASLLFSDDETAAAEYQEILRGMEMADNSELNLLIYSGSKGNVWGLMAVILLIMLCGYLLIYNILFISVNNDIRFFGQLKTIGTTKRQIKSIIFRQMGKLCMIGVPVGLGIGAVISFVVVPLGVMGMSGGYMIKDSNAVSVSFSPVIYIGAAALSILTTLVGSLKPAGIAGSISPIEALHYQGMALKNKKVNKRKNDTEKGRVPHKNKLYRMAWRNVFRGKKSAVLTFLSLFLGLSIFLVTTGILSSIDVSVIAEQYFAENEDISVTLYDNSKPMITEEMMSDIQNMDGVLDVTAYRKCADIGYEDGFDNTKGPFSGFLEMLYEVEPGLAQYEDAYHTGDLWKSNIVGINEREFGIIKEHLGLESSYEEFQEGRVSFYLCSSDMVKAFKPAPLPRSLDVVIGGKPYAFEMSAVPVDGQAEYLNLGTGLMPEYVMPYLLVSQDYMDGLGLNSTIQKLKITVMEGMERAVTEQIVTKFDNGNVVINSKYDKEQELNKSFSMIYMLGNSLSAILLFIGVMNFINTMSVNVTVRRHELAVLESIGMTKQQIRKMLAYEGVWYWTIPYILILSLGTAIFTGTFFFVKSSLIPYITYTYPAVPLTVSAVIVFAICILTPLVAYWSFSGDSVVDRLRKV